MDYPGSVFLCSQLGSEGWPPLPSLQGRQLVDRVEELVVQRVGMGVGGRGGGRGDGGDEVQGWRMDATS